MDVVLTAVKNDGDAVQCSVLAFRGGGDWKVNPLQEPGEVLFAS